MPELWKAWGVFGASFRKKSDFRSFFFGLFEHRMHPRLSAVLLSYHEIPHCQASFSDEVHRSTGKNYIL